MVRAPLCPPVCAFLCADAFRTWLRRDDAVLITGHTHEVRTPASL